MNLIGSTIRPPLLVRRTRNAAKCVKIFSPSPPRYGIHLRGGGGEESRDIKNRGIDRGRYDMEERLIRTHGVDCTYEGTRTTIVDGEG